jgi:glycosyltransferase involved in cell wall biosynthesis
MHDSVSPIASIIIPAYNEEKRISSLLSEIGERRKEEFFEIIVVCNGCTDHTFNIANSFQKNIIAINEKKASKINALNIGDKTATVFPRIYLDADVWLTWESLRKLVANMQLNNALAYGITVEFDVTNSSLFVRKYYEFWFQLPYFHSGTDVGSGLYALTKPARQRFAEFPDVIADDGFVNFMFSPDEKHIVKEAKMQVFAPGNLHSLVKIKTRSFAGRLQLKRRFGLKSVRSNTEMSLLSMGLRSPSNALGLLVYLNVQLICRLWGRATLRQKESITWLRDETSR